MNKQLESDFVMIKQLIDLGVVKGIFAHAGEVLAVTAAYNRIAGAIPRDTVEGQVTDKTFIERMEETLKKNKDGLQK